MNNASWVRRGRWASAFDLVEDGRVVATFDARGSLGVARVDGAAYTLQRIRLPAYVTLRGADSDELIARFGQIPVGGGLLAEFYDGTSYRLGWVRFWAREWTWVDERGEPVMCSRRSWSWKRPLEHDRRLDSKWRLLALLELASRELSTPFRMG